MFVWTPSDGAERLLDRSALDTAQGITSGNTPAANGTTPVAVAQTKVTATSEISLTLRTAAGTVGAPFVVSKTAGVGFSFQSTNAADTSVYRYRVVG